MHRRIEMLTHNRIVRPVKIHTPVYYRTVSMLSRFLSWGIRDRKGSHWSWGFWCVFQWQSSDFSIMSVFFQWHYLRNVSFFQSHWFSVWTFYHCFDLERRGLMGGARWLWFAYLHSLIMMKRHHCGPEVCSDPEHIANTYRNVLETPKL